MRKLADYEILEVLHESANSEVMLGRHFETGDTFVLKRLNQMFPPLRDLSRFRREYALSQKLQDLDGVIRTFDLLKDGNTLIIVMEDVGGRSLDQVVKEGPISLEALLPLAIDIVGILGQLHQRQVIHKDLTPANILWNPARTTVKIIDFGISAVIARENPTRQPPQVLEGTLPYLAPEQTGRMNRAVDHRSDLYTLGCTLYHLSTGAYPFEGLEPMELVHSHIAKMPPPAHEINEALPPIVSELLRKMMAKDVEERYQSAEELLQDLLHCQVLWEQGTLEKATELPRHSQSGVFAIPQRLFGRERECKLLYEAFRFACEGEVSWAIVTGPPGVGKSYLVQELQKPITACRGFFATGKFDQFNRDIPYYAIKQAFSELVDQLLVLSEEALSAWRVRLLEALGVNGQIMVELIPELAHVIGQQPEVPALPPNEANNRLRLVCQEFLKVFATHAHPLILFLDDLQWADQSSLSLLSHVSSDPGAAFILYVASYRDNEVDESHPVMDLLRDQENTHRPVLSLPLMPLREEHVQELLTEVLSCSLEEAAGLAGICHQKTGGNPFFLSQFLFALHERGLFQFDRERGRWDWQEEALKKVDMTDNVLDLMIAKIQKLPEQTQVLLKTAASIGNPFDLHILATVHGESFVSVARHLNVALEEGFLLPLTDDYKFAEQAYRDDPDDVEEGLSASFDVRYAFLHDRMQQALYSLLPEEEQQALHAHIGRALQELLSPEQRELRLFEIVKHLNRGVSTFESDEDRHQLALDNCKVADKARRSGAFAPALVCLEQGISLLGEEGWRHDYELMLRLHSLAVEMAYLCDKREQQQTYASALIKHAKTHQDACAAHEVEILYRMRHNNPIQALALSREVLKPFGITFPEKPSRLHVLLGLARVKWALWGKSDEELSNMPLMDDQAASVSMKILSGMGAPAYTLAPELLPLIVFQMVELTVAHGLSPHSPYAFASYGLITSGPLGWIREGYRFGRLAIAMQEQSKMPAQLPPVWMVYNSFIRNWVEPLRDSVQPLMESFQTGLSAGEFEFSAYSLTSHCTYALESGMPLFALNDVCQRAVASLERMNQVPALIQTKITAQFIKNLHEGVEDPVLFAGELFDEERDKDAFTDQSRSTNEVAFYLYKLRACIMFERWQEAIRWGETLQPLLSSTMGSFRLIRFYAQMCLAKLMLAKSEPKTKSAALSYVKAQRKKLIKWKAHCPANVSHLLALVEAESAHLQGKRYIAAERYDQSIALAKEEDLLPDEAQSYEFAARFYLSYEREELAVAYMKNAHHAYQRWGAFTKTHDLEQKYAHLLARRSRSDSQTGATHSSHSSHHTTTSQHTRTTNTKTPTQSMDLDTVLKVSQAISGEIVLADLLRLIMQAALENAGAQSGILILNYEDEWVVEAEMNEADAAFHHRRSLRSYQDIPPFSMRIVRYVLRTREPVILEDATASGQFHQDPYVLANEPTSVLCVPLLYKGDIRGALYLENNLTTGAFSPDRVELLQVILGQAMISLENAALYEGLEEKVEQRTQELQEQYIKLQEAQGQLIQSEKMASLGTLVAGVAHEINNPANFTYSGAQNIQTRLEQLRDLIYELIGDDPESEVAEMFREHFDPLFSNLAAIVDGTQRIRSIVTGLRTFSRLDESEYKEEHIVPGIQSTIPLVGANYGDDVDFVCEFEADPALDCWPAQLNQVFMNLTVNACQAILSKCNKDQRKGALATQKCGTLLIRTDMKDEAHLRITFKDDGVGMSESVKQRIFEPFFTTKDVGQGTGLGLSISHGIIEKHHGQFLVDSVQGEGTTIKLILPLKQPESSP